MLEVIYEGRRRVAEPHDYGERGSHARPHGFDVDGKVAVASMDLNHPIGPRVRWASHGTSNRDLLRYVQMELSRGKLPDGRHLVSEKNLLARRLKGVAIGQTASPHSEQPGRHGT